MTFPKLPPIAVRVIQLGVTLGLAALLWHFADGAGALRLLAGANPGWLALGFVALTVQTILSALRWRLTAAQLGIPLARSTALREYYLSQIVNQALPGGVLGDAGRAVRSRQPAGMMAAGQAVVFERLAGQIALFAVMATAYLATMITPGGLDWPTGARRAVGALVVLGLVLPAVLWALAQTRFGTGLANAGRANAGRANAGRANAGLANAGRANAGLANAGLAGQGAALWRALFAPAVRSRQIVLNLAAVVCNIAGFGACIYAVGIAMPIPAIMALVPLILLAMVIPLTISGWGLREGAAAALFPLAGASASDGLAASIAFGMVFLATVVPGLALLWLGTRTAPPPL